jgi:transcriptional regulator of acetoin/glycerol metabolism
MITWIEKLHRTWLHERGRDTEPALILDAAAAEAILLRPWPDNLRGLDRLVHSLAAKQTAEAGTLGYEALPAWLWQDPTTAPVAAPAPAPAAPEKPEAPTKEELAAVLAQNKGSVRATAKHFGRDRRQIYRWMEMFGLKGRD